MYHIKEDKRAKITTKLICKALTSLILEDRWNKLTITELVNKAQVGRSTFYRNFDYIEDVLEFQVDEVMDDLFQFIFSKIKPLPYFLELDLYNLFFRYWNQHDLLLKILIKSNQKPLLKNKFHSMYFDKLSFVQSLLNIQNSHWPYFVTLRSSMLSDGVFEWIQRGKTESPEEVSKILLLSFSELHSAKLSI